MMRIPTDAEVLCSDGYWGHSNCFIINPITKDITHFVVRERKFLENERLVPISLIAETTINSITLYCSKEELDDLPTFIKTHFISKEIPQYGMPGDNESYLAWPLVTYETIIDVEENIPIGELTFHKGANVEALDGHVGEVNEFIVQADGQHITHIVLDESHLFGTEHIVIPIADIQRIEHDCVYLNLRKDDVKNMPHHRHAI